MAGPVALRAAAWCTETGKHRCVYGRGWAPPAIPPSPPKFHSEQITLNGLCVCPPPKQTLPTPPGTHALALSGQELQLVSQLCYDILSAFIFFPENQGSTDVCDCFLFQAIRYSRLGACVCGAGEKAAMEQGKRACNTPLYLLTFLAGPRCTLQHLRSCSILVFAAAKNTRRTAPSHPEGDCHPIPTQRLLAVWTRAIFPMHPCLGSHSPFIDPSVNRPGPLPAAQSLHSAGVVETQSTQSLVWDFISPLKLETLWHEQCNQMWPGSEILKYPSTSLLNVMIGLISEQTCKALVSTRLGGNIPCSSVLK